MKKKSLLDEQLREITKMMLMMEWEQSVKAMKFIELLQSEKKIRLSCTEPTQMPFVYEKE